MPENPDSGVLFSSEARAVTVGDASPAGKLLDLASKASKVLDRYVTTMETNATAMEEIPMLDARDAKNAITLFLGLISAYHMSEKLRLMEEFNELRARQAKKSVYDDLRPGEVLKDAALARSQWSADDWQAMVRLSRKGLLAQAVEGKLTEKDQLAGTVAEADALLRPKALDPKLEVRP